MEPGDVDAFEASIKKADFLLLNNEVPEAVNLRAVDLAQRHGTRILFNPAANAAAAHRYCLHTDLRAAYAHRVN